MNIILLGPPGAGKGTQAIELAKEFNIQHISTGDIFRRNIKENTVLGIKAKEYLDKGELVPDEVTISIVEDRIVQDDCVNGFLLDGFPRTINQASAFDEVVKTLNLKVDYVINIDVPMESLIERITGRRVCLSCGGSYNIKYNKPKNEEICDKCSGKLIQREDDKVETVTNRLIVYTNQTAPLIEYYQNSGILYTVNGDQDINKVFDDICSILRSKK